VTARFVELAGYGESARPYSHLAPVLDAELEWGNRAPGGFCELPDGWWAATFMQPLHLDRLRAAFDFPDHIRVGRNNEGTTFVIDGHNRVSLVSPGPRASRGERRSVLSHILRR
jgi:hypothetical protein